MPVGVMEYLDRGAPSRRVSYCTTERRVLALAYLRMLTHLTFPMLSADSPSVASAAMAGVPLLNGFWSKELILEVGLEHSPIWAYALMLIGAGLTAFYTFRMVWLVFFGRERDHLHVHRAGSAMRVSLALLAGGTLLTWLLFGELNGLFASTLPFHQLESESLLHMVMAISTTPEKFPSAVRRATSSGAISAASAVSPHARAPPRRGAGARGNAASRAAW